MHSNVMHRYVVQTLQDPPLCNNTQNIQKVKKKERQPFHLVAACWKA
jgi:hypothetical protein